MTKGGGSPPRKRTEPGRRSAENSPQGEAGATERTGPVEAKVRSDLEALMTAHPMGESLSEMSLNLARTLDAGAGLATAAVNRELRANLVELTRMAVDDDDDLEARLSSPVQHPEDS